MKYTMFIFLLSLGPLLSEGSDNSSVSPASPTDSDTQASSGSSLAGRGSSTLGYSYSKGQGYSNTPSFPYFSPGSGFVRNYDNNYVAQVPWPSSSYYGSQRGDKSVYRGDGATGRVPGGYTPSTGYNPSGSYTYTSRFSKAYQDPYQGRHGGYNTPQYFRSNYVYGGSFQKGSSGYSYPGNTGQENRASRILYEHPKKAQFTIPTRTKSTGMYVVPTPSKLYYDGIKN